MKGIIYYTHNDIKDSILHGVQKQILKSGLPITSCSLKPIDFGANIVLDMQKGVMAYFNQIAMALEESKEESVFFCEHDILYHTSHFDFIPPRDDTFYYNSNVWKWEYGKTRVITYDHQASVSGLCVNRKLALEFYQNRLRLIYKEGYDKLPTWGNPTWARGLGYEPGGRTNGIESAVAGEWRSEFPLIDIRHGHNMTPKKMEEDGFRNKPTGWKEDSIENLPGWDKPWTLV